MSRESRVLAVSLIAGLITVLPAGWFAFRFAVHEVGDARYVSRERAAYDMADLQLQIVESRLRLLELDSTVRATDESERRQLQRDRERLLKRLKRKP